MDPDKVKPNAKLRMVLRVGSVSQSATTQGMASERRAQDILTFTDALASNEAAA